jgi:hypothetical protein
MPGSGIRFDISPLKERTMLNAYINAIYWNKKVKLAILALATFAALC